MATFEIPRLVLFVGDKTKRVGETTFSTGVQSADTWSDPTDNSPWGEEGD